MSKTISFNFTDFTIGILSSLNKQIFLIVLTLRRESDIIISLIHIHGGKIMKHIETIETRNLCESAKNGGCGECQTSCQSACKTSCGIANQQCENTEE